MKALEIVIVDSLILLSTHEELVERVTVNVNGKSHKVISEKSQMLSDWEIYLPSALSRIPRIKTAIMLKMFDWDPNSQESES
jgi:hypothetical protein